MSFQSRQPLTDRTAVFATTAAVRPSWRQRLALTLRLWRDRTAARRALADMDARSLRDAGIAPAAAAYEAGKSFWRPFGSLR